MHGKWIGQASQSLGIRDLLIWGKMLFFGIFRWDLGSAGVAMNRKCGFQVDGFSTHFEPCGFILYDLYYFYDFAIVSGGLRLFPEGPRILWPSESALKVPGPCETVSWWSNAASVRSQEHVAVS